MQSKYSGMSYRDLLREASKPICKKEARMLHKELKKYGDGLPFYSRYPDFPMWISIFTLVAFAVGLILR